MKAHLDTAPSPLATLAAHLVDDVSELCARMASLNRRAIAREPNRPLSPDAQDAEPHARGDH